MIAEKKDGVVSFIGYDTENNGKFIVEKGSLNSDWTYVNYQKDGFTQVIFGYVVKQEDGKYKAFQLGTMETNFKDRNVKYFDTVDEGVEYIKSLHKANNQ